MALATQCPHCQTTFRVAHDQLKLRAGLVRCGSCKEIFNGIEHLLRPTDQVEPSAPPDLPDLAATPSPPRVIDTPDASLAMSNDAPNDAPSDPAASSQSATPANAPGGDLTPLANDQVSSTTLAAETAIPHDDPLLRMTLMDITPTPAADVSFAPPATGDALDATIEDLKNKPWRNTASDTDEIDDVDTALSDIPDFVQRGQRQQRRGRQWHIAMMLASLLLLVVLMAQAVVVFRNHLVASYPNTKPLLLKICTLLGCELGLLAQIDAIAIESSELQASASDQNAFTLTMLLRNRSKMVQAWPHLELTLNDSNDKPIGRRIFTPRDYLSASQDKTTGFASDSEQSVKLAFTLTRLKASGFRVYMFYP